MFFEVMEFEERLLLYLSARSMEVSPVRANVGPDLGRSGCGPHSKSPLPLQEHKNATGT